MNGKTKSLIALVAALVGLLCGIVGLWFMAQPVVVIIGIVLSIVGIVFGAVTWLIGGRRAAGGKLPKEPDFWENVI